MTKRLFDIVCASIGLVVTSPILVVVSLVVWLEDLHSPFYVGIRAGRDGRPFRMVKFRSMVVHADRVGVDSTAGDDPRITTVGRMIRRFKIDEIPQLFNVLVGHMSFVGPRPNVAREVSCYTGEERQLLAVRPGITDLASIVFADESAILERSSDPDLTYNQIIRPWKSRLGLVYVRDAARLALDVRIILLTLVNIVDRESALRWVSAMVSRLGGGDELARVALRQQPLKAAPPPGASEDVAVRGLPANA